MGRLDLQRLERSASRLGDVVTDPTLWPDILTEVSGAVGAAGAGLLQADIRTPDIPRTQSCDELFRAYFSEGWHTRDDRAAHGVPLLLSGEQVIIDQDLFDPEQLRHAALYKEFLCRHGFGWFAAIGFRAGPAFWGLTIQRTIKEGPFEHADKRILATLAQRLTEVATLSTAVGRIALSSSIDALNAVRQPAIAVDCRGSVLAVNASAEQIFDDELYVLHRRLVIRDEGARHQLNALVDRMRSVADTEELATDPVVIRRQDRRRPILIRILPVHGAARTPFIGARAVLTLTPIQSSSPQDSTLIAKTFDLTRSEGKLACLIAQGLDPTQAAIRLGVSRETVRTQLKSIFAKTSTHRQSELVAMLSRLR
jgi:DNA-binding CsgD family transcriptional regulator